MKRNFWLPQHDNILIKYYPIEDNKIVANRLKRTKKAIGSRAKVLNLKKKVKFYKKTWTKKEEDFICDNYLKMTYAEIGEVIGKSRKLTEVHARYIGLKLPEELRKERSSLFCFKKGNVPFQKGKKWDDYMSKEAQANSRKTCYKKGQKSINELKDGDITVRKDKRGRFYKWIRLGPMKWEMLHVYLYKKFHGSIPQGKIVVFKDNNSMNMNSSNLIAITRSEHIIRCQQLDSYIVTRMAVRNKSLQKELLNQKDLLNLYRKNLELKRLNKEHEKTGKAKRIYRKKS